MDLFDDKNLFTRINRGFMNGEESKVIAKELNGLKTEVAVIGERVDNHCKAGEERTKSLFKKIGNIGDKLNTLPCQTHEERWKGLMTRVNWLYAFVTIVLIGGVVLGVWIRQ